ncbi:MAG: hypothetical protein EOO43_21175 [Flavobacterium sp.]|nr:MAG: hypothetical protein EOO43_21175 [Flavobacterium sp.]
MECAKQTTSNTDFALAKVLNTVLLEIIDLIRKTKSLDLPEDYELNDLNRTYVLFVDELEKLYERNTKLAEITPRL